MRYGQATVVALCIVAALLGVGMSRARQAPEAPSAWVTPGR